MLLGRHRYADEVHPAEQVAVIRERARAVVRGGRGRALTVHVHDADQLDVPQLGEDEQVVLAHVTGTHHARAQPGRSAGHHTGSLSGAAGTSPVSRLGAPQIPRRAPAMNSSRRVSGGIGGSSRRIRSTAPCGARPER